MPTASTCSEGLRRSRTEEEGAPDFPTVLLPFTPPTSDIKGGGKVMGKQGPWTLAFLGAGTEEAGSVTDAFFGVGRVQRDLGRSSLGVTWAGREADGRSQGSVSVDATLFFTQTLGVTAFFIRPSS